jgi:putative endonuclease
MLSFTRRRLLSDRTALAGWGERRARRFLEKQGCKTIARNYLCKTGELDLVMADPDGTIVFVEVKTRSTEDFAGPEDSVTAAKRKKLSRAAQYFLKAHKIEDRPCRFDVVAIKIGRTGPETIKHYPGAFA